MSKPILVTYATRQGSTTKVAEQIGSVLRREGAEADVRAMADVQALDAYRAVIIGSAVRGGRWLPEAAQFIKHFEANLINTPVAYFTVCGTLRDDTPENRRIVAAYHEPLLYDYPDIEPVSVGMFAGAVHYQKLSWPLRIYTYVVRLPQGDWHDDRKVDAWAREILPLLEYEAL